MLKPTAVNPIDYTTRFVDDFSIDELIRAGHKLVETTASAFPTKSPFGQPSLNTPTILQNWLTASRTHWVWFREFLAEMHRRYARLSASSHPLALDLLTIVTAEMPIRKNNPRTKTVDVVLELKKIAGAQ